VLTQVARGRHLHDNGVRHRDLAARNVLVKGRVFKVTDFGLSSVASDADAARMTSTIIGPVAWRAPETFRLDESKRQIASVQTDVYMLGGLMFEVLTAGRHAPFFWMSAEHLIMLRATTSINTVDAASANGVAIPWAIALDAGWTGVADGVERLKALMSRCLDAEPSRRPSLDDFLAELEAIRGISVVTDGGYGGVPDGGYGTVIGDGGAAPPAIVSAPPRHIASGAGSALPGATASVAAASTAQASPMVGAASASVSPGGAAAQVVDVVDMSEASAALVALQIDAGVVDRVCEAMVVVAAEIGHVAGDRFLQIVVDKGVNWWR
jgi:hypothetical protein